MKRGLALLRETAEEVREDRLTLVAAGVTFYLLLAIFPVMAALASIYGLFTDPALLEQQLAAFGGFAPKAVVDLLRSHLQEFINQARGRFELGLLFGVGAAVWAVNRAVSTLFMALNVVYDQEESRSRLRKLLMTLAFSVGVLLLLAAWVAILGFAPVLLRPLGLDASYVSLLRWPTLLLLSGLGVALLYRYGPSRAPADLGWISWGGTLAVVIWLAGSFAFSWYFRRFSAYDATYGSLAALAGLLIWLWMSAFVLLVGAELNAGLERRRSGAAESSMSSGEQGHGRSRQGRSS